MDLQLAAYKADKYQFIDPPKSLRALFPRKRIRMLPDSRGHFGSDREAAERLDMAQARVAREAIEVPPRQGAFHAKQNLAAGIRQLAGRTAPGPITIHAG